jgi:hypothetical protein
MKKFFKILALLLFIFIAILIAVPFVLESKIDTIVQSYADKNLDADLSFDNVSLSLISSFPSAEIHVENLKITNRAPFKNETLATVKDLAFAMPIGELFKGNENPLIVNEIIAKELLLTLKTNTNGTDNYDIIKENGSSSNPETTTSESFSFDIQNYEVNNSALTYIDEESNTTFYITELNHSGKGIFSQDLSQLETNTEARISLSIDSTSYLSNTSLKLAALIDLNLEDNIYTFKDNKGFVNALPLELEGFVKLVENGQELDLKFRNPESSFKDFLAVMPEAYAKNIENVSTTGNFTLNGAIKGLLSEETIPTFDISMQSDNASFKYPDLPKQVDNIQLQAHIKNTTGKAKDTYVDINTLNFKIDKDIFKSEAHIKNLTENITVDAYLDGVLNLANISKAYPVTLENQLSGILKGQLNTSFDMEAIETNNFQRIKSNGAVSMQNLVFSLSDFESPIQINTAELSFKPGTVTLKSLEAVTGKSDFSAVGKINNLLGFLLSDKNLQGNFNINSNIFSIADFLVKNETPINGSDEKSSSSAAFKIPGFLDCTIVAKANTVIYDNLQLKNVKGQLLIKDEKANLSNMTTAIFNGQIAVSGNVSTQGIQPDFDLKLGMNNLDISQSFSDLKILKAMAPIAKVLEGKLNSTIDIRGLLDSSFSPDLATISGNTLAEIHTTSINTNESAILTSLDNNLNFIDLRDLNLNDVKASLSFENGQVLVKPFTINYKDIPIEISGTHSFSSAINYSAVLQVPAKYLGSDVNRLIGQINDSEVNKVSIPITADIKGTFKQPKISTDLSSGVSNLTKQLIAIQTQKLTNQGKDKLSDLLGGVLGNSKADSPNPNNTETDSSNSASVKGDIEKNVKSVLGDILSGKTKPKNKKEVDSTKNK